MGVIAYVTAASASLSLFWKKMMREYLMNNMCAPIVRIKVSRERMNRVVGKHIPTVGSPWRLTRLTHRATTSITFSWPSWNIFCYFTLDQSILEVVAAHKLLS